MFKKLIRKTLLLVTLLFFILLAFGCSNGNDEEDINVDIDTGDKQEELFVKDYFPIIDNTLYSYEGLGNEYATYSVYTDYTLDNKVQYVKDNGGTVSAEIYSVENGEVRKLYSEGELYYREDYLRNPTLIEYNMDEVVLKEPLVEGNSWDIGDGKVASITDISKDLSTGVGDFEVIEVTKEETDGNKTINYYASGIGLVKSEYVIAGGDTISSTLKEINEDYSNSIRMKLYYPDVNDYSIYYINVEIPYKTNDITRKLIESAYRDSLNQNMLDSGLIPVFTENTKINYLYLMDNNGVRMDLSGEYISEMIAGSGVESAMLEAMVDTFTDYYGTDKINLTIDNNSYGSGHIYIDKSDYIYSKVSEAVEFK